MECRWPDEDRNEDGQHTFCGCATMDGSSYCPAHAELSKGQGTASERNALGLLRKAAACAQSSSFARLLASIISSRSTFSELLGSAISAQHGVKRLALCEASATPTARSAKRCGAIPAPSSITAARKAKLSSAIGCAGSVSKAVRHDRDDAKASRTSKIY